MGMGHYRIGIYSIFILTIIFLVWNISENYAYAIGLQIHMTPGASLGGCELTYTCYDMVWYQIAPGTVVTWINYDSTAHTVRSEDEFDGYDINSGNIEPGETFTVVFSVESSVMYFCTIHPWMEATIEIDASFPDTTPPSIPTLFQPTDNQVLTNNIPTFDWTDTADESEYYTEVYDLIVDDNSGFANPEIYQEGLFKSEFTALSALPDNTYYWKVRPADAGGNTGNYGPTFSFTINTGPPPDTTPPPAPLLTQPVDNIVTTDMTPTFDWNDVTDPSMPVTYTLLVDDNPTFSSPEIDVSDLTSSSYTPPSPLAVDNYYWKVRAYDDASNVSPDSSVFAVTINVSSPDFDGDGVPDSSDNCINVSNPSQKNTDGDAQGDACDSDDDNDGIVDSSDSCPLQPETFNGYQDTDGCPDTPPPSAPASPPPTTPSTPPPTTPSTTPPPTTPSTPTQPATTPPSTQTSSIDYDNDGISDNSDNCVLDSNPDQKNTDGDALGDVCDSDDDNDAIPDATDQCPLEAETFNGFEDEDGCPESVTTTQQESSQALVGDFDGDSIADEIDNCLIDSNPDQMDTDGDGLGDVCDTDDGPTVTADDMDGDGIRDGLDNCLTISNPSQTNNDGDSQGDACDSDDDNDSISDTVDQCPLQAETFNGFNDADGCPDAEETGLIQNPLFLTILGAVVVVGAGFGFSMLRKSKGGSK